MKNKIWTLLVSLIVNVCVVQAEIVSGDCGPNIRWVLDLGNGEFTIIGEGEMGEISWTRYRNSIQYIHIPEGVTSICDYAFAESQIREVKLPESIISIGKQAFAYCTKLTSIWDVKIPNSVTTIGEAAFAGCTTIPGVTWGNSIESIGAYAFYGCTNMASISFPSSITTIGDYAFTECTSLTSIELPESLTSLGSFAFAGCANITSANLPNSITNLGGAVFLQCNNLFTPIYNNTFFAYLPSFYEGEYIIPDNISYVAAYAFADCTKLTNVVIPNSVKLIWNSAFFNCPGLTQVKIPNSVTHIGSELFKNCTGLREAIIPNSVISLADGTFYNCSNLTTCVIGDNVPQLGEYTFYGCTNLTNVSIGKSVANIPYNAFIECEKLTNIVWNVKHYDDFTETQTPFYCYEMSTERKNFDIRSQIQSITFGSDVEDIPAFLCYGFKNITTTSLPTGLKSIGQCAFKDCGLIDISIPEGVIDIASGAFSDCTALRNVALPSTLNHIGAYAFSGTFFANKDANWEDGSLYVGKYLLSGSRYATIKDGTYLIADYACNYQQLQSIDIPKSVKIIGASAFANNNIKEVQLSDNLEFIGERAFADNNIFSIIVPATILYIGEDAFKGVTNILYDGTVSGAPWGGKFLNAYEENNVLYDSKQKREVLSYRELNIRHLAIPNSVVKIHEDAFNRDRYSFVRSLVLGPNIEEIGDRAFTDLNNLDTIFSFLEKPIAISNSVFGYLDFPNTLLYVPKDQLEDYLRADVWKQFDVVPMIAKTVPIEEEVVISATEDEAQIIVAEIDGATIYELTITLFDGTLVATYVYNSKGELQRTIFHSPSRNMERTGFLFIVSGLDRGTNYKYSVVAKDDLENVITTIDGSFETQGDAPQSLDQITNDQSTCTNKVIRNGQFLILRGENVYTVDGQQVK